MTSTDICNLALSYLSKGKITSMDDNTEEAAQCKIHYDHARRLLLRQYPWGFAKRTVKLALLAGKEPGWDFAYAYPAGCLAVRYVFDEEGASAKEEHVQDFDTAMLTGNQKALLTDVELAWCEYTYNVKDVDVISHRWMPKYRTVQRIFGWKVFHIFCRIYGSFVRNIKQIRIYATKD